MTGIDFLDPTSTTPTSSLRYRISSGRSGRSGKSPIGGDNTDTLAQLSNGGTTEHKSNMKADRSARPWFSGFGRTRYVRIVFVVAVCTLFFFLVAPGDRVRMEKYVGSHNPFTGSARPRPPAGAGTPDLTTSRCSTSYSTDKPLVQFAIVIDAGSTGSRIHVYRFNNCGPSPELENEVFEQTAIKPGGAGLSAYGNDPEEAARSLDPLLAVAMREVPDQVKSCTPIVVKATAGLRALGPGPSDAILAAVRHRLESEYPFALLSADRGGVEVMAGTDEGVYAWVTINYLLGNLGPDRDQTAAVFDLGGGSTQIVFEPTFPDRPGGSKSAKLADGDHKYELGFGDRRFTLYQHSYLDYGLMSARKRLHRIVLEGAFEKHGRSATADDWLSKPVVNPCINPGQSRAVTVELEEGHPLGKSVKVVMTGPRNGSSASSVVCRGLLEHMFSKDAPCLLEPCSFEGVHQPSLVETFGREDIYLFSYFWDRARELGMPSSYSITDLKAVVDLVCAGGKDGQWDVFESVPGAIAGLAGRPEECLDLAYMFTLLHAGYEIPLEREVRMAKKLKGMELGWCLGASLAMLNSGSESACRIREVSG